MKTLAWFVCWGCRCAEVNLEKAKLPEVCPGHGRQPITKPEQLEVLNEFLDSHDCGNDVCEVIA